MTSYIVLFVRETKNDPWFIVGLVKSSYLKEIADLKREKYINRLDWSYVAHSWKIKKDARACSLKIPNLIDKMLIEIYDK